MYFGTYVVLLLKLKEVLALDAIQAADKKEPINIIMELSTNQQTALKVIEYLRYVASAEFTLDSAIRSVISKWIDDNDVV